MNKPSQSSLWALASISGLLLFSSVAQADFFGHDAPPDPYASAPDKTGEWSATCQKAGFTGEVRGHFSVSASQWTVAVTDYRMVQAGRQKVSGESSLLFRLGNAPHGGNESGWDKSATSVDSTGEWRAPVRNLQQTRYLVGDILPTVEFIFDKADIEAKCFANTLLSR